MLRHIGLGLTALLLAAAPLVYGQSYFVHIVSLAMISAIAALGMQLVLGFAGSSRSVRPRFSALVLMHRRY